MEKPAANDHPVNELIRRRWSPRAFADKPLAPDVLRSLFEAARWAPSNSNEQPWAFLVATRDDKPNFGKALQALAESNVTWAQNAWVLGFSIAELAFARTGAPNRNAFFDVGASMAYLSMEATSRGLFVHQMGGFSPERVRELFGVPAGWEAAAAFAIGYPGEADSLPEPYRTREMLPRQRKPLAELVMSGEWGHPAPFLSGS